MYSFFMYKKNALHFSPKNTQIFTPLFSLTLFTTTYYYHSPSKTTTSGKCTNLKNSQSAPSNLSFTHSSDLTQHHTTLLFLFACSAAARLPSFMCFVIEPSAKIERKLACNRWSHTHTLFVFVVLCVFVSFVQQRGVCVLIVMVVGVSVTSLLLDMF